MRLNYKVDGGYEYGESVTRFVQYPELGLFVKFGGRVTITEGQTLLVLNSFLSAKVPAPELLDGIKMAIKVSYRCNSSQALHWMMCGLHWAPLRSARSVMN